MHESQTLNIDLYAFVYVTYWLSNVSVIDNSKKASLLFFKPLVNVMCLPTELTWSVNCGKSWDLTFTQVSTSWNTVSMSAWAEDMKALKGQWWEKHMRVPHKASLNCVPNVWYCLAGWDCQVLLCLLNIFGSNTPFHLLDVTDPFFFKFNLSIYFCIKARGVSTVLP